MRGRTSTREAEAIRYAKRIATCGACGAEWEVTASMLRDPYAQYLARRNEPTDQFYCGCQDG